MSCATLGCHETGLHLPPALSPSATAAPWTLCPQTRCKEFLLLPSLQKSMESWDFSKLFCLHCSLFLKNQPSLLINTACSRNGHPLPFLPRNLETVSKCCSLQLLGSYSVHRAEKKIHWSCLIREVLLELEVCGKSLSLHRFFIDLYMECADMVFV